MQRLNFKAGSPRILEYPRNVLEFKRVLENYNCPGKVSWKMSKQDQIMISGSETLPENVGHLWSKAWYDYSTVELCQSTDCRL